MLLSLLIQLLLCVSIKSSAENEDPVLYYYGIEESERSLPECGTRQACSVVLQRYWRAPALVRLCRCARRKHRCDTIASIDSKIEFNNRAHFQFCQPINDWPLCSSNIIHLNINTTHNRINPDELEELHHKNIQLVPPKVTFNCRCRDLYNYWKPNSTSSVENNQSYQCASLSLCKTGEFCGNVNYDFSALYQSCLCPKKHICVHSGGVAKNYISELLYSGKGWKAHCQRISNEDSYEDY